jgi:hypothetical protein
MIGTCDNCDRQNIPVSHLDGTYCGDTTQCFLCQGDSDADPYGEFEEALMQVDRGLSRETAVMCAVDRSSEIAGQIICIECGGDGNWGKFAPEIVGADCDCVECKGTGRIWVSI